MSVKLPTKWWHNIKQQGGPSGPCVTDARHDSDPHAHVYRVFAEMEHRRWPRDWAGHQCITVAQLCTGHSPVAGGLSAPYWMTRLRLLPHCNGAKKNGEHPVLHCAAHDQAQRESWPNIHYKAIRDAWSFLERIGAVTHPLTGNERERERRTFTIIYCRMKLTTPISPKQ